MSKRFFLPYCVIALLTGLIPASAQIVQVRNYMDYDGDRKTLDSLRTKYPNTVAPENSDHELATLLALGHYEEIQRNRIRIKYKKNVRYPITASYSFFNIFKLRRWHTYVLLIKPGSFVERINLNQQVGLIGHEMAHFVYYRERPTICMVPWAFRYVFSRKFRSKFEHDADYLAIEKGLGWQYLDMSIYLSRQEVLSHMEKTNLYDFNFNP